MSSRVFGWHFLSVFFGNTGVHPEIGGLLGLETRATMGLTLTVHDFFGRFQGEEQGSGGTCMVYQLIDSGAGEKIEGLGPYKVRRQAAQAFWAPSQARAAWDQVEALHVRSREGGGHWEFKSSLPESWNLKWGDFLFKIKLTPFGHIGLFPEQAPNWDWLKKKIKMHLPSAEILNLFAYTGGSTLAAARAGATVTHVDASKGVVSWARENAALNQLENKPVRWIVDDVAKFVQREERRGRTFKGLILDPPTYGRGAKGETWKIEDDLLPFLWKIKKIVPELDLLLISCHSPGFSGRVLAQMSAQVFGLKIEEMEMGEMITPCAKGMDLPSGFFARWCRFA